MQAAGTPVYGRGFVVWASVSLALGVLMFVGAASIGIFIVPTLAAMLLSMAMWRWPWAVTALTAAGLAFSIAYAGSLPLTCWQASSVQVAGGDAITRTSDSGCTRLFLPDLPRADRPGDRALALRVATGSAAIGGVLAGGTAFVIARRRSTPRRA